MNKPDKQFDPAGQFEQVLAEVDVKIHELAVTLDRLRWLRERMAEEFARVRDAADPVFLMSEEQAAEIFGVKTTHLAELRRTHDLPHCKFGPFVRYTRQQMAAACDILSMNNKRFAAGMKKAA